MIFLRSILFAIILYLWSTILSPLYIPLMICRRRIFWRFCLSWCRSCLWIINKTLGIDFEIRGLKNLPTDRPFIVASKHQSAWDTLIFNIIISDCAYVVKRELFWLPFFGWYLRRVGMIGINRKGGTIAIKRLITSCKTVLAGGRSIVIFPQGTRTPPGSTKTYLPGVGALYTQLKVPVVPAALNSGLFWPRRTILKRSGCIVVEFLPVIKSGLSSREFLNKLEGTIEPATKQLEEEARRKLKMNRN